MASPSNYVPFWPSPASSTLNLESDMDYSSISSEEAPDISYVDVRDHVFWFDDGNVVINVYDHNKYERHQYREWHHL